MENNEHKIRPAVMWFAQQMENKLRENDHKGGWEACKESYLKKRLLDEYHEVSMLLRVPKQRRSEARVVSECADAANFAMMIADNHAKKIGQ